MVDEIIQIHIIREGYLLQHIHKFLKIIKKQMDQLFEKFEEGLTKEEIQMVNKYIELNC